MCQCFNPHSLRSCWRLAEIPEAAVFQSCCVSLEMLGVGGGAVFLLLSKAQIQYFCFIHVGNGGEGKPTKLSYQMWNCCYVADVVKGLVFLLLSQFNCFFSSFIFWSLLTGLKLNSLSKMELEQSGFVSVLGKPWAELCSPEPSSMPYFWYCLGNSSNFLHGVWCRDSCSCFWKSGGSPCWILHGVFQQLNWNAGGRQCNAKWYHRALKA